MELCLAIMLAATGISRVQGLDNSI